MRIVGALLLGLLAFAAQAIEADKLVQAAREQAYAEGFQHGHDAGAQAVRDAMEASMRRTAEETAVRMAQLLKTTSEHLKASEQQISRHILELACDLARQVVRRELQQTTDHLQPVITEGRFDFQGDSDAMIVRGLIAVLHALLARADVLVENFRPGVMARLGLADDDLAARFPTLIRVSITGFGPDGPRAQDKAYDAVIQALGGLACSQRDAATGAPVILASTVSDKVTALTAATLAEGVPYPRVYSACDGLLSAIELAPAARVWAGAIAQYETLLLAELGYAEDYDADSAPVAMMAQNRKRLVAHVLGDRRADVMAARERLVERLKRAVA